MKTILAVLAISVAMQGAVVAIAHADDKGEGATFVCKAKNDNKKEEFTIYNVVKAVKVKNDWTVTTKDGFVHTFDQTSKELCSHNIPRS